MSEPNNSALILGVLREIGRDIRASIIEELGPRLDALAASMARLEEGEGASRDLLQNIEQHLVALGRLGGEIHSRVSSDTALPRDLLAQPALAAFCEHYPDHAAPAIDTDKLANTKAH